MLHNLHDCMSTINPDQKQFFDTITNASKQQRRHLLCLQSWWDRKNLFVKKHYQLSFVQEGETPINVASIAILSLLLSGVELLIQDSYFLLSINETFTCNMKNNSPRAELLLKAKLIIWDEAQLMHKYC